MQFQFYLSPLGCNIQNITHNMDETKDETGIYVSSYKFLFFSYWFSISSLHEVKGKTEIADHFSLTQHTSFFFLFSSFVIFRIVLVSPSIQLRFTSEDKAKFYRTSIEHLSKIYRRPIEDLSNIYRRPIEDLSKRVCVNCFIGCPVKRSKFGLFFWIFWFVL